MAFQLKYVVIVLLFFHVSVSSAQGPKLLWTGIDTGTSESHFLKLEGSGHTIYTSLADQGTIEANVLLSNILSVMIGISYDYAQNLVFWTDPTRKTISKASFTTGYVNPIYDEVSISVEGITVDWINKKLYWTDASYNWIMVSDYDGVYVHTLIYTGLDRPRGIAVYPVMGHLYWCDIGTIGKILRSNLNGEHIEIIVSENDNANLISKPNGLTIDYEENRLYWVDSGLKKIMSVDIDNNFYRVSEVFEEQTFRFPFDISLDQGYFFVSDHTIGNIWVIDRSNTDNNISVSFGNIKPFGMTFFSEWRQQGTQGTCASNNGGCEQLCVGDPNGHKCLCKHGYVLASDQSSCTVDTHLVPGHQIIFSTHDSLCRIPVDFAYASQPVNEVCFRNGIQATAMDYDYSQDTLYFYDSASQALRRTILRGGESIENIVTNLTNVHGLAIDWLADNIYWTNSDGIYISKLNGLYKTRLLSDNINEPRGIAVHPGKKFLFWADNGPTHRIQKSSLSGRQRVAIVSDLPSSPTAVTIDFFNDRLYWVYVESLYAKIESCNFNGHERKNIGVTPENTGLTIFQDHIYWTGQQQIMDFNHVAHREVGSITVSSSPKAILAFERSKQALSPGPCDIQNGNCDEICIPTTAGAECVCSQPQSPTCTSVARCTMEIFSGSMTGSCINTPGYTCRFQCNDYFVPTTVSGVLCQENGEWDIDTNTLCKLDINLQFFLLVGDTGSDGGKIFHVNVLSPTLEYVPLPLTDIGNPIALDFDYVDNKVYWTDVLSKTITRASLDGSDREVILSVDIDVPDGIACDVVNRRIYWTDTGTDRIERANLDGSGRVGLITSNLDEPRAIIVDSDDSSLYWSDWGTLAKIETANLDGSGRRSLVSTNLGWPNGLALDKIDQKLFWCDAALDSIEYYDLRIGTRQRLITLSDPDAHPFGLAVVGDYLYWTQWDKSQLQRADKHTGNNVISVGHQIFERPNDIHVFSSAAPTTLPTTTTTTTTTTTDIPTTTNRTPKESTESASNNSKQSSSSIAIGGAGAGGGILVVTIIIIVILVLYCRRKNKIKRRDNHDNNMVIYDVLNDPGKEGICINTTAQIYGDQVIPSAPPAPGNVQHGSEVDMCRASRLYEEPDKRKTRENPYTFYDGSHVALPRKPDIDLKKASGYYEEPVTGELQAQKNAASDKAKFFDHTYMDVNHHAPEQHHHSGGGIVPKPYQEYLQVDMKQPRHEQQGLDQTRMKPSLYQDIKQTNPQYSQYQDLKRPQPSAQNGLKMETTPSPQHIYMSMKSDPSTEAQYDSLKLDEGIQSPWSPPQQGGTVELAKEQQSVMEPTQNQNQQQQLYTSMKP
ncbi:uncharacterized protein LOC144451797 [Glandiceps talaboti]